MPRNTQQKSPVNEAGQDYGLRPPPVKPTGRLVIAILDRGWVFVGRATESPSAITLENADCIRRWGTTDGIGQLALEGPRRETKLDPAGTVTVPRSSVIALIDASEPSWPGR